MRKFGWLLITTAIFTVVTTWPFAEGYNRNLGIIGSIQSMMLRITADEYKPVVFIASDPIDEHVSKYYAPIEYDHSGKFVFFHNSISEEEQLKILHAAKADIESSSAKHLISNGEWKVSQYGFKLLFSQVVAVSAVLAFIGIVLLIFARP